MPRRSGVLAAVTLLAATLVGVTAPARAPLASGPVGVSVAAVTSGSAPDCADVLLLGIDGNGEEPRVGDRFGRTLDVVDRAWRRAADRAGRTVEFHRVDLATAPAAELVALPGRGAREAVGPRRARAWRSPVVPGVRAVRGAVTAHLTRCPDRPVVIAGHAQGAAVAHRVLERYRRDGDLSFLLGAVLVSDPERRARSNAGDLRGAPPARPHGGGVLTRVLGPRADVPRETPVLAIEQVCTAGDLVCDPRRTSVPRALRRAHGYRFGDGAVAVRRATLAVHRSSLLRPVPSPRTQLVELGVGEEVATQPPWRLVADVDPDAAPGLVWAAGDELPPGLELAADGTLTGAVDEPGSWRVGVTVRGTDPLTPAAEGTLAVVVRTEATSTSAGGMASCETRTDGSAWCWGRNNWGQLGDGTTSGPRDLPTRVATDADWVEIDTSGATTCAIRADGTLWCWGLNHHGQLGVGLGGVRSTPVQVGSATSWTGVSTGWFHTCGTRANGTLWCWGLGGRGQLGRGSTASTARPARVGDARDWESVSVGGWYTCGLRAGTAWCWGQNDLGQLGLGRLGQRRVPTQVGDATTWQTISASWAHTCGTTADGAGWCWGRNDEGQVGDGTRADRTSPTRVPGDRTWTILTTGDAATCGVDAAGSGWCWGSNRYGQLGDGGDRDSPAATEVVADQPWASVDAGWWHSCGRFLNGTTACWGNNELGQVGDGSRADGPQPKEVG